MIVAIIRQKIISKKKRIWLVAVRHIIMPISELSTSYAHLWITFYQAENKR